MLTLDQLKACLPDSGDRAAIFLECLNHAMTEFDVTTLLRQACFLAQVAHESGQLRYTAEVWGPTPTQKAYEGRADLGNTHVGDGSKYRGRGLLQITGRSNYERCGFGLGRNLIDDPAYLETPMGACRSAAWFWKANGLSEIADVGNFGTLTRKINGGFNGLDDRIRHYIRVRKALGI